MHPSDLDRPTRAPRATDRRRGQVIVIFAGAMLLFAMLAAAVIDLSWYWTSNLRMQRAADAAALAGVVFLPGDPASAITAARTEAAKNGYAHGTAGVVVSPVQDPTNNRRLLVTISGNVGTFFARVAGITSWPASRTSKSEFVLPVPMGSPENYYGVFGTVRTPGGGTNVASTVNHTNEQTSWISVSATKGTSGWSNPTRVYTSNNSRSASAINNRQQAWGDLNLSLPSNAVIKGIEVGVEARRAGSGNSSDCRIRFHLSWNDGSSWTSGSGQKDTPALTTTEPGAPYYVLGDTSDTWNRTWDPDEFDDNEFRVRATTIKPNTTACANAISHQIDHLRVRVTYDWVETTTTFVPDSNLTGPSGQALNPRGFWATMLTQGADDINGDAYLPGYEGGSTTNPEYQPGKYYDYAVEMAAGSSNGQVFIYDPVFCATNSSGEYGTGDRWFGSATPTSSFYQLWDTKNTPFDLTDDTRVDPTGDDNLFRRIQASDESLNGPGVGGSTQDCEQGATTNQADGRYWHNRWWPLATGLNGGTTYRVRTMTTDPNSANDQVNADGQNSFAIWTTATGTAPKVFGVGAMQSFSPLPGNATSEFYLAQIDDVHAGKTVVISLWDPGDTGSLTGQISIRIPSSSGYTSASLNWSSAKGTTHSNASSCNGLTGSGTSIATHSGSSQRFNGCWVTIEIPIPTSYTTTTAPPGEAEPGWWKIRYVMSGSSSDTSLDVTTWQVSIRGNPVHLVLP
jgi:Flp pilus assembly protein TadG